MLLNEKILEILKTVDKQGVGCSRKTKEIKQDVWEATSFLPIESKVMERFYCILNNILEPVKCPICKLKFLKYKTNLDGYREYCSIKCANNSEEIKLKRKQTCLERYGVESSNQSEQMKRKSKQTCLERYGVEYAIQNTTIKQKQVQSIKDNGGYDNIVKKTKETKLERYGSEGYNNREKSKQTNLIRYGFENPSLNIDVKNKKEATCLLKYGYKTNLMNPEQKEKIENTRLEKYGVRYMLQDKTTWQKTHISRMEKYGSCRANAKKQYSKISQSLFWDIFNQLEEKEKIYFAELNKEFNIQSNGKLYAFDFVNSKTKKCVEFNGDRFHANPDIFNENDCPNPFKKDLTSKEIWDLDIIKQNALKEKGFEIYIVWETDYILNPENTIKKCLEFLSN